MSDYIEREALCYQLAKQATIDGQPRAIRRAAKIVSDFPAADVRPVVRGKWIKPTRVPDSMLDECSVCGFDTGAYTFNYCPNCGADMRHEGGES